MERAWHPLPSASSHRSHSRLGNRKHSELDQGGLSLAFRKLGGYLLRLPHVGVNLNREPQMVSVFPVGFHLKPHRNRTLYPEGAVHQNKHLEKNAKILEKPRTKKQPIAEWFQDLVHGSEHVSPGVSHVSKKPAKKNRENQKRPLRPNR